MSGETVSYLNEQCSNNKKGGGQFFQEKSIKEKSERKINPKGLERRKGKKRKGGGVVGEKLRPSLGKKGGDVSKVFGPAILEWVWIDPRQNTRLVKKNGKK